MSFHFYYEQLFFFIELFSGFTPNSGLTFGVLFLVKKSQQKVTFVWAVLVGKFTGTRKGGHVSRLEQILITTLATATQPKKKSKGGGREGGLKTVQSREEKCQHVVSGIFTKFEKLSKTG